MHDMQQLLPMIEDPMLLADVARVRAIIDDRIKARPPVAQIVAQMPGARDAALPYAQLTLLAARLSGETDQSRALHAAATIELIATAMHIHSSLVDQAARRRHTVSPHTEWQGSAELMTGDYVLTLAATEMALSPDPQLIAAFARCVRQISEGRLAPVISVRPLETALREYHAHTSATVGAIAATACAAGAICAGQQPVIVAALAEYGLQLGTAVQMLNEALDYAGDPQQPAQRAVALRAGIITLPLIYAAAAGASAPAAALDTRLDPPRAHTLADAVVAVGGVAETIRAAAAALDRAQRELQQLPATPARDTLALIVHDIGSRTRKAD